VSIDTESLFGLPLQDPLPPGHPLDVIAVVKVLPDDGERPFIAVVSTASLSSWEALGMLTAARRTQEDDIAESFRSARPSDEDEGEG
jgi:hypothetical protein